MTKVTDPVCGMVIDDRAAAARGQYGGVTVYFCSAGCQVRYEASRRPPG